MDLFWKNLYVEQTSLKDVRKKWGHACHCWRIWALLGFEERIVNGNVTVNWSPINDLFWKNLCWTSISKGYHFFCDVVYNQVAGLDACARLMRLDISGNQLTNLEVSHPSLVMVFNYFGILVFNHSTSNKWDKQTFPALHPNMRVILMISKAKFHFVVISLYFLELIWISYSLSKGRFTFFNDHVIPPIMLTIEPKIDNNF
jgi:hypothetical protein